MPGDVSLALRRGQMSGFIHLRYVGETTSPWHIGMLHQHVVGGRSISYMRTRTDLMWGRGIRGPVLRQLWRSYCPHSDLGDGAAFNPERDCIRCRTSSECPFNNLRGSNDEGEWKGRPRLILTNLRLMTPKSLRPRRLSITSLDEENMRSIRAGCIIEYIPSGTRFSFEAILMAEGSSFEQDFDRAVRISLEFLGWGGRCNEGFGRGRILEAERNNFESFWRRYVVERAESILDGRELELSIETLLILDRDSGGFYTSSAEPKFREKLCNCINERFWQFTGGRVYLQEAVDAVSGGRFGIIRGWSRRFSRELFFRGIAGSIKVALRRGLRPEEAQALALTRYGVGRYKNQGLGAMAPGGGS